MGGAFFAGPALAEPTTLIYIHSGGTDPVTGEPSRASRSRVSYAPLSYYQEDLVAGSAQLIIGGGQTRKSGPWAQCDKLKEYVVAKGRIPAYAIRAIPETTDATFIKLAQGYPDIASLIFVNDDVHMARYLAKFCLLDRSYARKVRPVPVITGAAYAVKYSADYVACYSALGWGQLAVQSLKALFRPITAWQKTLAAKPRLVLGSFIAAGKALILTLTAIERVGGDQFYLFLNDRLLNHETIDPAKRRRLAYVRQHLRPDLLGE